MREADSATESLCSGVKGRLCGEAENRLFLSLPREASQSEIEHVSKRIQAMYTLRRLTVKVVFSLAGGSSCPSSLSSWSTFALASSTIFPGGLSDTGILLCAKNPTEASPSTEVPWLVSTLRDVRARAKSGDTKPRLTKSLRAATLPTRPSFHTMSTSSDNDCLYLFAEELWVDGGFPWLFSVATLMHDNSRSAHDFNSQGSSFATVLCIPKFSC